MDRCTDAACELCGGDRFEDLVLAYDRVVARRRDYLYRRCLLCSLVSMDPSSWEGGSAYPSDYAPHNPDRRRAGRPHRTRGVVPLRGAHRLLDIGCGSGELLERHRDLGWKVSGIEPNERAAMACRARGLDVQAADLFEVRLPDTHFDAILLHHVIEHVPSPADALRRVRNALAPGGVAIVVTPNVRSLGFGIYRSCWYAIDAPRHLRLFDARTLTALALRAGLSAVSIRSEPSARVLARSRHYHRTQGPVLPPGLAPRVAILDRSQAEDARGEGRRARAFRRAMRLLSWGGARVGRGESLRAEFIAAESAR